MTAHEKPVPDADHESNRSAGDCEPSTADMTTWLTGLVQTELWNEMRRWVGSSRPTALGGKESASDIMQSAFRLAYVNRHQCQAETPDERANWFRTIVKRKLYSLHRRYATSARSVARERADAEPQELPLADRTLASADAPDVNAMIRELEANIAAVFREIPESQLEVIYLRFYEQLSRAEIAARLEISPGQVAGRMRSALSKLRTLLEDRFGAEDDL